MSLLQKHQLMTLCVLLLLYALVLIAGHLTQVFALLGAVLLLTYVLTGPVDWVEDKFKALPLFKKPRFQAPRWQVRRRAFSIALVYLFFAVMITLSAWRTLPTLTSQIRDFANDLPFYTHRIQARLDRVSQEFALPQSSPILQDTQLAEPFTGLMARYVSNTWEFLVSLGAITLATCIYVLTALVMVFYCLLDGALLQRSAVQFFPVGIRSQVDHYLTAIHTVLENFIKTQVVLSILAGLYLYLLFVCLGVKYATFLSVLYAVASVVPVIGPWFGILPALGVIAFSDQPLYLIHVMLFTGAFYLMKEYWLMPGMIRAEMVKKEGAVQSQVEIHPVIIIVTFLVCLQLGGVPGVLLSFPLSGLICGTYQYLAQRQYLAQCQKDA